MRVFTSFFCCIMHCIYSYCGCIMRVLTVPVVVLCLCLPLTVFVSSLCLPHPVPVQCSVYTKLMLLYNTFCLPLHVTVYILFCVYHFPFPYTALCLPLPVPVIISDFTTSCCWILISVYHFQFLWPYLSQAVQWQERVCDPDDHPTPPASPSHPAVTQ